MEVKQGSPKSTVTIWTPTNVYELHTDMNFQKMSEILSIVVTSSIGSITGSFSIQFVPRPDKEGKLWSEKLHSFDYVEIKLKGADDPTEEVVCRGLIDDVSMQESYEGGTPRRSIKVSGRNLGALLTDFYIAYLIGYDTWANILKVFGWKSNITEKLAVNAQEAFDLIMGRWKEIVDLTVGTLVTSRSNVESEVVPRSLNLSSKIDYKARAFFPDMKTTFTHVISFEGPIYNALEVYRDKPWHELFMYEGKERSMFILRPAYLKDMKGNPPLEVTTLKDSNEGSIFYQKGLEIKSIDILNQDFNVNIALMNNYFFTVPKLSLLYGNDWLSTCTGMAPNRPWASINPWMAVKWENNEKNPEPLAYIGRYGLRPMTCTSTFIATNDSLGELAKTLRVAKESGGNPDNPELAATRRYSGQYVKPSDINKKGMEKDPLGKYDDCVQKASQKHTMPPEAIYALMTCEEDKGNAKRRTGCDYKNGVPTSTSWGLMQINDAKSRGHTYGGPGPNPNPPGWLNDPALAKDSNGNPMWTDACSNIDYGTSYFKQLYNDPVWKNESHEKKLQLAADAYCTGAGNVHTALRKGTWRGDGSPGQYSFITNPPDADWQMQRHQANFNAAYSKMTGVFLATEWKKQQDQQNSTGIISVPEVDVNGKKIIRDVIKDEQTWFGIRLNQVLVAWFLHNYLLRSGSVTIRGTNQANIGTYAKIIEDKIQGKTRKNYEYYIETVSHNFTLFVGYTTSLQLSRGQPEKDIGGLCSEGYEGVFYFDTNRTVSQTSYEAYQKLSDEKKKVKQTDETKVPLTPEQVAKSKVHEEA